MATEKGQTNHLYIQLADLLLNLINSGVYPEGTLLPSERELSKQYDVSRTTVRQAIAELRNKGYVKSIHGTGNIVSKNQIQQELCSIYSFNDDMEKIGKKPETKILDFVEILATDKLIKLFNLPENSSIYRVIRLRLADGEPMLLETNYLPCSRFPDLTKTDLEHNSLYTLLSEKYHLEIQIAEESFEPVYLRPMELQIFGASKWSLGMLVERIAYENGQAIEFSKSVSPSYKFKHHVVLKQPNGVAMTCEVENLSRLNGSE